MDSDPLAFTWRVARARHLTAAALAALGALLMAGAVPVLLLHLLVVVQGPEGAERELGPLAHLPARMDVAAGGLALALVLTALVLLTVLRICATAEARAATALRGLASEALAAAAGGRDDVRALPALTGAALRAGRGLLGTGIALPAFAATASLLAVLIALSSAPLARPWPALAAAAGLAAAFAAGLRARERDAAAVALRAAEDVAAERAIAGLAARLPALRAHGTAAFERRRVEAAAEARRSASSAAERQAALARAVAFAATAAGALAAPVAAAWSVDSGPPASALAAALFAGLLPGLLSLRALALAWYARSGARAAFAELAASIGSFHARRAPERGGPALPGAGEFVLRGIAAYDPGSGERVSGVDLSFSLPAHVALVGERGGGARALAQLLAGQGEPTAGTATFAGIDLAAADPVARAKRFAYAGGEPILVPGTLRQNLLYGTRAADEADAEQRLVEALTITGLDRLVYARGLTGPVGETATPALAEAFVGARQTVRERLAREGAEGLVDPFDPARYNRHATVGENILFGVPVGAAFADEGLSGHPFLRAVIEAEGLTGALSAMGLSIAQGTAEIFADLPDDHPLFDRFSLVPASERGYFEDIVARRSEGGRGRRGTAGDRERRSLIGLALRYSETRHRLGLADEAFEARVVSARRTFAMLMPAELGRAIEFYDPARIIAAASLQDNLLFGRIAEDEAGAETRVRALVRDVLSESGLDAEVYRVGLAGGVAVRGEEALSAVELAAVDLARCLVRRPDVLVVENALDDLPAGEAAAVVGRLQGAFAGRGLIVRLPSTLDRDAADLAGAGFDLVLRVDRGTLVDATRAAA